MILINLDTDSIDTFSVSPMTHNTPAGDICLELVPNKGATPGYRLALNDQEAIALIAKLSSFLANKSARK